MKKYAILLFAALLAVGPITYGVAAQPAAETAAPVTPELRDTQPTDPTPTKEEVATKPPLGVTEVSTTPIYDDIKEAVNWALTLAGTLLGGFVAYWLKLNADSSVNAALHAALQRGAAIAAEAINSRIDKHLPSKIDVGNTIAAAAANYAIENRAAAVKYMGVDRAKLEELARAYIPPVPAKS